jgi:hypothetical protein
LPWARILQAFGLKSANPPVSIEGVGSLKVARSRIISLSFTIGKVSYDSVELFRPTRKNLRTSERLVG